MLVGRVEEKARLERLLDAARRGQHDALVLWGEPGIGKTTLLRYAVERAADLTVVSATGVEAETELEYSGLLELTRPLLGHLAAIPSHQADALREALGLAPSQRRDRFIVGAALLSLLAAAADENPLLVVVDDVQWLDRASGDAIQFAARRLLADRIALLFAIRADDRRILLDSDFDALHVEGLGLDDVALLLDGSVEGTLPADAVARIREATTGNPLALIELTDKLSPQEIAAWRDDAEPLPIASHLGKAFSARLADLPDEVRLAALVVAICTVADVQPVARALDAAGLGLTPLERAEDAGLVSIAEGRVTFRHPLVRSAVYQAASPSERRRVHRAVADSLGDDEVVLRASHLAGAALGPDEEVAAVVAAAAASAATRGGYAASSLTLEKAAQLTPDPQAKLDRLAEAAEMAWMAGAAAQTLRLLDTAELLPELPAQRARLLHLRGRVERRVGVSARATDLLREAAALVEQDSPLDAARILSTATVTAFIAADLPSSLHLARRLRGLVPHDSSYLDAHADETLGWVLYVCGQADEGTPLLERALRLLLGTENPSWATLCHAVGILRLLERPRESQELAARAARVARQEGPRALLSVLELLTRWEVQDGRWSHAIAHGEEGIALANALGHADQLSIQLVKLASVNAARGEGELCRGRVDQACREADGHGLAVIRPPAGAAVGLLELSTGQAADAIPHLHRAVAEEERIGVHDRDHAPQPDLVEALVQTGRRDEAAALLERYTDVAARATPVWGGALVARCRGLLDDSFDEPFDQALALHSRVEDRFQEARTLLNYGERLRRAGRKVEARERLRAALAIFDELHGTPWAERASRELRATGERIRRARPATGEELTPQELQVAMAVAEGVSNKAAAAALFISPKTVEFHLGSIYRKVGVSSRRELIRRFSTDRAAVVGSA